VEDLPKAIADAIGSVFDQTLKQALDAFLTALNESLPKLLIQTFFAFIASIADWIYQGLSDVLGRLNIVTQTPPELTILESPAVQNMFRGLTGIAFAAVAIVVVLIGFGIMARTAFGGSFPDLLAILPRLVIALLWIVTTPLWFGWALSFTNAICQAIAGTSPLPGWDAMSISSDPTQQFTANAIATLVYVTAGVLLFVQSVIRIAVLDFATVLAPFALLCWVLPSWYWLYAIWLRIFVAAFLTQLLQALAVGLGSALLGGLTSMLGPMGPATTLVTAAIGLATVMAAWTLPRQIVGSYGPSLALPSLVLAGVTAGAAVTRGMGAMGAMGGVASAATAAGAIAGAGAGVGITSIVPLPPPPVGAPMGPIAGAPPVPSFPSIPEFPG
jgi:hypothetical protein